MPTYHALKTREFEHATTYFIAYEIDAYVCSRSVSFRHCLPRNYFYVTLPLLYCDGFWLVFVMTLDLSCFHGNTQTSRFRHWHGTHWQRTRATIDVEVLG